MALTLNDLTVDFSHLNGETLFDDWRWLVPKSLQPILICASGDAFIQCIETGAVYCLDVGEGNLVKVSEDIDSFRESLGKIEFVSNYFAPQMVGDLIAQGNVLQHSQIYSLRKPLVLGGEYTLENIEVTDIEVHFALTGQIHAKVRDLPEGTTIESVSIS
ncbi:MAG: T6SS immunity protein Tdi1 domain-containing protein [Pseudomonadota bacterium]